MTNTKIDGVAGTNQRISEASDFANGLQAPELNQEEEAKLEAAFLKMTTADDIEMMREAFGSLRGFQLATKAARAQEPETAYATLSAFGFARFLARRERELLDCIQQQNEFIQAVNELTMSDNKHAMIFASMLAAKYRGKNLMMFPAENGPVVVS